MVNATMTVKANHDINTVVFKGIPRFLKNFVSLDGDKI